MEIIKKPNGTYVLTPTAEESLVLDFIHSTKGSQYLKNFLEEHIQQRSRQRDYDDLQEIHRELLTLSEVDKAEIRASLKGALQVARSKKKVK